MDTKTLVKALKTAVREVIKEELTEILREGLQSTINEMAQPKKSVKTETVRVAPRMVNESSRKPKVQFSENKWASVLNETDGLVESNSNALTDYAQLMTEGMDELRFTSKDAQGFGMMRQQMQSTTSAPKVMEDPETGKVYDVTPEVADAMTRDYSALMKAMNKKKG
jgi:hypothetical protein